MKTLISIYGHIYVGHLIVEINELFWKGLTILSMGNHVYWSWVARLKTQNSRKCRNAQKFSTTPMSPKKRSSYSLRCRKVSKTPFKMHYQILSYIIFLKVAFQEILPIPRFRSGSVAQNEYVESTEILSFSLNSKDFCQGQT